MCAFGMCFHDFGVSLYLVEWIPHFPLSDKSHAAGVRKHVKGLPGPLPQGLYIHSCISVCVFWIFVCICARVSVMTFSVSAPVSVYVSVSVSAFVLVSFALSISLLLCSFLCMIYICHGVFVYFRLHIVGICVDTCQYIRYHMYIFSSLAFVAQCLESACLFLSNLCGLLKI